ncbi:hypothetical protein BJV78DRAFT_751632 [Lactifluus subvellereus]|nr:hypothetical protein BJV78DRAFT_751632 [Lactifluus subvellereus]
MGTLCNAYTSSGARGVSVLSAPGDGLLYCTPIFPSRINFRFGKSALHPSLQHTASGSTQRSLLPRLSMLVRSQV